MTQVFHMMKFLAVYSYENFPSNLELLNYFPILKLLSAKATSSTHLAGQNLLKIEQV